MTLTGTTYYLVLQASDTDLTGITFDESVTDVDFNLNGKTGIIMTVDQADNKTITKGGGTYIIKDNYANITLLVQMMGLLLLMFQIPSIIWRK